MNVSIETVTPEIAAGMLTHLVPERQRKLSLKVVENYSRMMKAGMWKLTHQGIGFDTNGELIDGQHRLHSVVKSGATVQMLVAREIEGENTIDALDRGEERRVGQQLQLRHGFTKGRDVSHLCRQILVILCASHWKQAGKFNVGYALNVYEAYSDEINFVLERRSTTKGLRSCTLMTACVFAMGAHKESMRDFYSKITNTVRDEDKDNAAYALRKYLRQNPVFTFKSEMSGIKTILMCAMRFHKNEPVALIREGEEGYNFFLESQREKVDKVLQQCGFID